MDSSFMTPITRCFLQCILLWKDLSMGSHTVAKVLLMSCELSSQYTCYASCSLTWFNQKRLLLRLLACRKGYILLSKGILKETASQPIILRKRCWLLGSQESTNVFKSWTLSDGVAKTCMAIIASVAFARLTVEMSAVKYLGGTQTRKELAREASEREKGFNEDEQ